MGGHVGGGDELLSIISQNTEGCQVVLQRVIHQHKTPRICLEQNNAFSTQRSTATLVCWTTIQCTTKQGHVSTGEGWDKQPCKTHVYKGECIKKEGTCTHHAVRMIIDIAITLELFWPDPQRDNQLKYYQYVDFPQGIDTILNWTDLNWRICRWTFWCTPEMFVV